MKPGNLLNEELATIIGRGQAAIEHPEVTDLTRHLGFARRGEIRAFRLSSRPEGGGEMSLIGLVLALMVIGALFWLLNNYVPMDAKIGRMATSAAPILTSQAR